MKKLTLLLALTMILFSCKPEAEKPTVTTKSVGEITETTAKVVGQVTADGGAEVTERGVCWNTAPAPEVIHYRVKDAEGGLGIFTLNLSNLEPQTTYYVRAYATNEKGVSYGEELTFTTKKEIELPEVKTAEVEDITESEAVSGGEVVSDGGAEVTARGICWSTSPNPTIEDNKTEDGSGVGSFTSQIPNLVTNTQYYVRAYATNEAGTSYGEEVSFTTLEETNVSTRTFTVNGVSFTMIAVEGGTFKMGATSEQGSDYWDDELPVHSVTLSSYSIGETEVTQELWEAVMGSNPSYFSGYPQRSVEYVTWNDCQEFITKLNNLTGKSFRLPTEAEWEYAARGGNKSKGYKYSGSNTIGDVAWYYNNSGLAHDVKTKQANELGIYDMSGNVWEWCQDWYGSYSSSSQTNPTGPSTSHSRVLRGGGWCDDAGDCRVSVRYGYYPGNRYSDLGLRLCLSQY